MERLAESGARRVWVEKILAPNERLPPWPVAGTTGYEFMAEVTALFLDARVEGVWTELYGAATGERRSFEDVASEAKLEQARTTFAVEVDRLRPLLPADSSDADIAQALASLPLYRTYVDPTASEISDADRAVIHAADMDPRLQRLLALERRGHDAFVTRFQQTSPAVAAKGVEDTALYRYNRLLALNDVGADPGRFGLSVGAFHAACRDRQLEHPLTMLATSTHDTKRSARRSRSARCARLNPRALGSAPAGDASRGGRARRSEHRVLRPANDRRGLAALRRTPAAVPGEGAPGGEARDELDRAEHRVEGP